MSARKIGGIGHVRPRTKGTSNEISFSVLDAKSVEEPAKGKSKSKGKQKVQSGSNAPQTVNKLGKVSLFTTPSTNSVTDSASSTSGAGQVGRWHSAQRVRGPRGVGAIVGGIAAALAVVALVVWGVVPQLQQPAANPAAVVQGSADSSAPAGAASADGASAPASAAGTSDGAATATSTSDGAAPASDSAAAATAATSTSDGAAAAPSSTQPGAAIPAAADSSQSAPAQPASQAATIDEAFSRVAESDEALFLLDQSLASESVLSNQQLTNVQEKVRLAKLSLGAAATKASAAQMHAADESETAVSEQLAEAAEARTLMLETGEMLLRQDAGAVQAIACAREAWEYVLEGDAQAREAARLVSQDDVTNAVIRTSKQASEAAASYFASALELFEEAKSSYPAANWTTMLEYVQLRMTASTAAADGNQALLDGEKQRADANTANANAAEDQAAALAQDFAEDTTQPIMDAYQAQQRDHLATYEEARTRAARADAALCAYEG